MRKWFLSLMCMVLVVTAITVRISMFVTAENGTTEENTSKLDIIGTSPVEWSTYADYSSYVWTDPSIFVGETADFNEEYDSFVVAKSIAAINGEDFSNNSYMSVSENKFYNSKNEFVKVVIKESYCYKVDGYAEVWFRIEAAEEDTTLEILDTYPWILYNTQNSFTKAEEPKPALYFETLMGTFAKDTVTVKTKAEAACYFQDVSATEYPEFFEVTHLVNENWEGYDLGEIAALGSAGADYHYVDADSIILVPTAVYNAYESLMDAKTPAEFEEILESISDSVLSKFTAKEKENVVARIEELVYAENNVEHSTKVVLADGITEVEVSVKGKIPQTGVTLSVDVIDNEEYLHSEGLIDVEGEDVIITLDIKMLNDDGSEWQPGEDENVRVSIDMAALGYEDGTVFKLRHKHGDEIFVKNVLVVENGKLNFRTGGFSLYQVQKVRDKNRVQDGISASSGGSFTLEIGDRKILYFDSSTAKGTWTVEDRTGAIYYTVYSEDTDDSTIGHNRVSARWIEIYALKETAQNQGVTLKYNYASGNGISTETFTVNIVRPSADPGKKQLYLQDDVNSSGRLIATLVDDQGNILSDGLDGAAFAWTRDDGMFIVPDAYDSTYKSVNIARDHGGLVEARKIIDSTTKEEIGYDPVTYTCVATLADGSTTSASYTVYYQSEIINASFEFPNAKDGDYSFFPNGWAELYWKTTAPGSTATNNKDQKVTQDIEYADVRRQQNGSLQDGGASFGVMAGEGYQFAEINAEAFGALYQDIITVPYEDIDWGFLHAARSQLGDYNSMYIIVGPTQYAQELTTQSLLEALGNQAETKATNEGISGFWTGQTPVVVEYTNTVTNNTAKYTVWYHTASVNDNPRWTTVSGTYQAPEGQYRTRILFVTDKNGNTQYPNNGNNPNYGNMIDNSIAGQYKNYIVEYYLESYSGGQLTVQKLSDYTETGSALLYSSVVLNNFNKLIGLEALTQGQNDRLDYYLHEIRVNGNLYPYDVHYMQNEANGGNNNTNNGSNSSTTDTSARLYIEKYGTVPSGYSNYDLVMQVYMRDMVVSVDKELRFPAALTDEQELTIMKALSQVTQSTGYESQVKLSAINSDETKTTADTATVVVTNRDPKGNYKGYVGFEYDLVAGQQYIVEETGMTEIEGLILNEVKIDVTRYRYGNTVQGDAFVEETYIGEKIHDPNQREALESVPFSLEPTAKVAEVKIINTYVEEETTIYYKAIGNGKVKLKPKAGVVDPEDPTFQDTPSETLAYYSGESRGVEVHAGEGAIFVGWFKDEACTQPVEARDGSVSNDNSFKPNANIITETDITFYAKFVTGSVTIKRTNGQPGKTYVYRVVGDAIDNELTDVDMYVTVTCDQNGNGQVVISESNIGTYTVTELSSWTWRHGKNNLTASGQHNKAKIDQLDDLYSQLTQQGLTAEQKTQIQNDIDDTLKELNLTLEFNSNVSNKTWLDGFSNAVKNVFGGGQ